MRLDGTTLTIVPDPFGGRVIEINIEAREIPNQRFASAHDARTILAGAPVVTLKGIVKGSAVHDDDAHRDKNAKTGKLRSPRRPLQPGDEEH